MRREARRTDRVVVNWHPAAPWLHLPHARGLSADRSRRGTSSCVRQATLYTYAGPLSPRVHVVGCEATVKRSARVSATVHGQASEDCWGPLVFAGTTR